MQLILKNLKSILITLFLIAFAIIVYLNSSKLVNWFKSLFTNISASETPTAQDLVNPSYVIDSKVIKNYVDLIVSSVDKFGTDEKTLNEIYLNLKDSHKSNTLAVWNEFKNRRLKYSPTWGGFNSGIILGEDMNLYQVLSSELNNSQSEKNCLINWKSLLKKHGLI